MAPEKSTPEVCIVTPVYNEEQSLDAYQAKVCATLLAHTDIVFRVLFVDDGSSDRSWQMIEEICSGNERFQGIRLSRNFGAHAALTAGITHAQPCDAIAILACDLQDPPEVILEFVEQWRAGAQVVWGLRHTRAEQNWRIWASKMFFRLIQRHAMPRGSKFSTGSFLLLDWRVVECFREFRERNRVTFALVAWTGFEQAQVLYNRKARAAGSSGWTFGRMIKAMYDIFVGFSHLPARLITLTGVLTSAASGLFLVYLVIRYLQNSVQPGWTGLMFAVTAFFGVAFLMLGTIGEYLHRIYTEVAARPLYFISQTTDRIQAAKPGDE